MANRALLRRLRALPAGVRRDLLRVLLADSCVRADLIRQFYGCEDTRNLADLLMDLEAEPEMRLRVMGLLKESVKE